MGWDPEEAILTQEGGGGCGVSTWSLNATGMQVHHVYTTMAHGTLSPTTPYAVPCVRSVYLSVCLSDELAAVPSARAPLTVPEERVWRGEEGESCLSWPFSLCVWLGVHPVLTERMTRTHGPLPRS